MDIELRRKAIGMLRAIVDQDIPEIDPEIVEAARNLVSYMNDAEILSFGEGKNKTRVSQIPGTECYAAYKHAFTSGAAFTIGPRDGCIKSAKDRAGLNPEMIDDRYVWFDQLSDEEKKSLKDASGVVQKPSGAAQSISLGDGSKKISKPAVRRVKPKKRSISLGD